MNFIKGVTLCFITLVVASVYCQVITEPFLGIPTTIPFLGTKPVTLLPPITNRVGQLITTISQISTFKFWVCGTGSGIARVTLAPWDEYGVARAPVAERTFTLSNAIRWTPITIVFNVENLDPLFTYVLYITFSEKPNEFMRIATTSIPEIGGMVTSTNTNKWTPHYSNLLFELTSTSTLTLYHRNYAEGPSSTITCRFRSTYHAIQVDWTTLVVNTGYFVNTTTTVIQGWNCPSFAPVPYGTAANCDPSEFATAKIDLRGTQWAIKDAFETGGNSGDGMELFTASDNQAADLQGTGECGWIATRTANEHGEPAVLRTGGMFLQLEHYQI